MKNAIEIKNVSKEYQDFKLDNINITVPEGSIVGLIGENGAGKTTTIKGILNISNVTGTIKIFGKSPEKKEVKQELELILYDSFLSF